MEKNIIEFGKIVNTHGLKGEVKVYSYTDNVSKILKLKKVFINNVWYKIESIKLFKNMFLMKLSGVDNINTTTSLINSMVYREIEQNESNEEQGYFIQDLIGLEVLDENLKKIGVLTEVLKTGANDVYEITDNNGKIIYIPAIKDVVKKIDIHSKKIVIKLMEGLI